MRDVRSNHRTSGLMLQRSASLEPPRGLGDSALGAGFAFVFALAAFSGPALAADAFSTDWAGSGKWQARLIAASNGLAGFEIRLAPGAITYWRNPGDSGLPPTFDFAASDNVEAVDPAFPAPMRIREADGGEAFGYDGSVIFPLRVKPRDAAKPVTLALNADFAVCEKVCLPAKARLTMTLPAAGASPYTASIGAALAAVPRAVAQQDFGTLESAGAGNWRLCAPRAEGPARDLFVEPPEGWWLTTAPISAEAGRDCFKITLGDKPKDAALPVTLRMTLTGGAGPVETTIRAGR
jgi:DsbC/DsbD-like thiol-disulfide interchange protein